MCKLRRKHRPRRSLLFRLQHLLKTELLEPEAKETHLRAPSLLRSRFRLIPGLRCRLMRRVVWGHVTMRSALRTSRSIASFIRWR